MKKNILVVLRGLDKNGISSYVERTYTKLVNSYDIKIDVLTLTNKNLKSSEETLIKSGIEIITVPTFKSNPIQHIRKIRRIIKRDYDVVHFHIDNWANFVPIYMAQKNKNSKVFIQSHNSKSTKIEKSFSKYSVHKVVKKISGNWNVCRIAVSEEAGKWLFNPDDKFKIINNPVDVNRFKFSFKDRTYIRRKYNISEDEILFGNVARMDYQKNPLYLVKIFKEIRQINKKIKLILIGSGVLKNEVTEFIYKNKLEKDVIIIDWTDKVWMFYSAIDEIIFPSLYEGFPLSLIEAQCSGCNIVYSDTVTKDIQLLETTISFPLRRSAVEWAKLSLKNFDVYQLNKFEKRIEASNMLLDKGLDYQTYIKMLMKLYD